MATDREPPTDTSGPPAGATEDGGSGGPVGPDEPDLYPGVRDRSKQSLRDERDFWKHLFDSLVEEFPEAVIVVDDDGILTHWNESHEEIANIPAEEVIGRNAYEVLGTDGVEETLAEEVARTGRSIREDDLRTTTDPEGNRYHIRCSGTPLRAPDGEVVGAFELVSQVTDLVEQRETLEDLQERMAEEVEALVDELLDSAERIAAGSQQIGAVATDQAGNLDDLSGEIERLSATIEEIATSAEEVNRMSGQAEDVVVESHETAETTLAHVSDVSDAGDLLSENTRALRNRVEEIDRIVTVIDDIADQTNLLALNASIEAARAGEAGGGFAVVAEEVKALAEQSKQEAGEIEGIVGDITGTIEDTVGNVEEANDRIDDAVDQIETMMDNQQRISDAISQTSVGMDEIADATSEQSRAAEEISTMIQEAVRGVDEVSEEIETLSTANERQAERAAEVQGNVGRIEAHLAESTDD